jgi:hypothetical protein
MIRSRIRKAMANIMPINQPAVATLSLGTLIGLSVGEIKAF